MFKKLQRFRLQLAVVLVIVIALLSLVTLTACQDSDTGNSTNDNGNGVNDNDMNENDIKNIYVIVGDNKIKVELSQNAATNALIERLKDGNITYTARDYGGFEKVGNIGISLPTNDTVIQAETGDVMLYQGNQIVVFYGSNRYSYTRIGRINGYSAAQLRSALSVDNGDVLITLSLD